jgi:LmbE family N-acetylglucosaminyl deacetylase
MFSKKDKILIVAAHPDDETLGCSGLILKIIKKKIKISVLILGEGVSARYKIGLEDSPKSIIDRKKRVKSFLKSMKFLKIKDYELYNYHCTKFDKYPISNFVKIIEKKIIEYRPTTIITHNPFDTNIDHGITYEAVNIASRPSLNSSVKTVISFEVPCSTHLSIKNNFKPNLFIDISKEMNSKLKCASFYKDEIRKYPFPRSYEGIKTLSKMRGMQSGSNFAEAFYIERKIVK